jgi:pimeloyl-ACP methyl ester carboxylesterase
LLKWQPPQEWGVPVFQSHGERDRTLPSSRTRADVIVPGGDHMLPYTCPKQVNGFLMDRMGQHGAVASGEAGIQ